MKTHTLFVTTLIAGSLAVFPAISLATCALHKSQQVGNETAVGGNKVAGGEGTGVESKKIAGGEGTGVEGKKMAGGEGTGVEGKKMAGGEGTGVDGAILAGNETAVGGSPQ